jgi:MFS transporter, DHA1 family, multidrug resistance protein
LSSDFPFLKGATLKFPQLIFMSLYNALVYGILYLIFFAYPYCFQGLRGWSVGTASLPFLAMLVGILLAFVGQSVFNNGWWTRRFVARGNKLNPEDRLPPMAVSAVLLPTGLFMFAWTSSPHIHWAPQVVSGVFVGAGIMLNLTSSVSYLIDVYLLSANSALAANTCIRSVAAAAFPLFADQMYTRLGSEWATSLLGFLCLVMVPVPWVFWKYGKIIRGWSRYGVDA